MNTQTQAPAEGREQVEELAQALIVAGLDPGDLARSIHQMVRDGLLARKTPSRAALSKPAADFFDEHSGLTAEQIAASDEAETWNTARLIVDTTSLLRDALSTEEVADRLRISTSSVRHRKRDGALYALPAQGGSLRFPMWQFQEVEGTWRVIPHLKEVLAALPDGLHPLVVSEFFTEPRDWLMLDDEPMSVRSWLFSGGKVARALTGAESYFVLG